MVVEFYGFPSYLETLDYAVCDNNFVSVLINGEPSPPFRPRCGLRQGDPLSPYLFILVMELLSRMVLKLEETSGIQGIKIVRPGPSISYVSILR